MIFTFPNEATAQVLAPQVGQMSASPTHVLL